MHAKKLTKEVHKYGITQKELWPLPIHFPLCYWSSHFESKHQHIWGYVVLESREGNGTPLQYSCLENPMDGGAWWAAVHGVARSRT